MGLLKDDLNKTAVAMGKVIKLLDDVQGKLSWGNDLYEHKEALYGIAYVCRVGILDRIEKNHWSMNMPIAIPSGIFKFKKMPLATALMQTVVRLKEISQQDVTIENNVNDILDGVGFYHEFVSIFSEEQMAQLHKSI